MSSNKDFVNLTEWPAAVETVSIRSTADGADQRAKFYAPKSRGPAPLLMVLHTWSGNYDQKEAGAAFAGWCIQSGWNFMHPDFRGPNSGPEAMGSELVVQDLLDAVAFARQRAPVDDCRIYLTGGSGGGYAALLMAGRAPEIWAGVSAWCPITNLAAWYYECQRSGHSYAGDIVKAAGGIPAPGSPAAAECRKRSAVTYLHGQLNLPIDINAGIHDGHTGSVPIGHSLRAFNALACETDRIADADIQTMEREERIPTNLQLAGEDPSYGQRRVLFRRVSGLARVTIFEGGHDSIPEAALAWLSRQKRA